MKIIFFIKFLWLSNSISVARTNVTGEQNKIWSHKKIVVMDGIMEKQ
jgi:hypothetical protein